MPAMVVLVTGGSTGIGLATCNFLKNKGCKVYGTSRKAKNGAERNGIPMLYLDLNNSQSIKEAVGYVIEKEGRIDVLVNNAGTGVAGPIEDMSTQEVNDAFKTNVFGQLDCCRQVIPYMREQNTGKIINISSIAGEFGLPFRGVYSATKSAIDRFSETLRMELSPWNIHVSIVQPGDFKTNINNNRQVAQKSLSNGSAYKDVFTREHKRISDHVSTAKDPVFVARAVWKIVRTKAPKMRYPAATFWQRFSLSLNRVLPSHLFQKILVDRYPVK
jgi:NAD(P)-dependent dehydrogenase (short-subunit alcohol dehydrogenase family)